MKSPSLEGRLGGAEKLTLHELKIGVSQYYDCTCPDCGNAVTPLSIGEGAGVRCLSATEKGKIQSAFNKVARWAYKEKKTDITLDDLDNKNVQGLTNEINSILQGALQAGISYEIPATMMQHFSDNVYVFSGCKTYDELRALGDLLKDDKGEIKPFSKYFNDVRQVHEKYNKNYLESEYLFATQSAQMASKWADFEKDGDHYNLQYRTAKDSRVRYEHAILHDTTLPPSDPFWSKFFPPNGWRCRCNVVQVRVNRYPASDSTTANDLGEKATYTVGKGGVNTSAMFRFNPGKEKIVFPSHHPYFKDKGVVTKVKETSTKKDDNVVLKRLADAYENKETYLDLDESMEFADKRGLTKAERVSVNMYSYSDYKFINSNLRDGKPSSDTISHVNVINRALDKLEIFKGQVFRGANLSEKQLDIYMKAWKDNKVIVENTFTSTSLNRRNADNFGDMMFRIESKTGRDITKVSRYGEHESEVLFRPGTKFKVKEFKYDGGYPAITLEEI